MSPAFIQIGAVFEQNIDEVVLHSRQKRKDTRRCQTESRATPV